MRSMISGDFTCGSGRRIGHARVGVGRALDLGGHGAPRADRAGLDATLELLVAPLVLAAAPAPARVVRAQRGGGSRSRTHPVQPTALVRRPWQRWRRRCRRPAAGSPARASARRRRGCRARPPAGSALRGRSSSSWAAHAATSPPNPAVSTSSCTTTSAVGAAHRLADDLVVPWCDACAGRSPRPRSRSSLQALRGLQRLLDRRAPRHDRDVAAAVVVTSPSPERQRHSPAAGYGSRV